LISTFSLAAISSVSHLVFPNSISIFQCYGRANRKKASNHQKLISCCPWSLAPYTLSDVLVPRRNRWRKAANRIWAAVGRFGGY